MLSELKAISYKLPIFNKKINNLIGIVKGESGEDGGYRVETPNDSNLLTLEDLQQNLQMIKSQLLNEIRETQSTFAQTQNRELVSTNNVLTRLEELEKINKDGAHVKRFKREIEEIYETVENIKNAVFN
jgi:hypothetical protein